MARTCLYFNREIAFHADREIAINYQNNNNIKFTLFQRYCLNWNNSMYTLFSMKFFIWKKLYELEKKFFYNLPAGV